MKFFNKHIVASLLLILIINTDIIIANEKIKRKTNIKSNKYNSQYTACNTKVSTFNYSIFLITALKRILSRINYSEQEQNELDSQEDDDEDEDDYEDDSEEDQGNIGSEVDKEDEEDKNNKFQNISCKKRVIKIFRNKKKLLMKEQIKLVTQLKNEYYNVKYQNQGFTPIQTQLIESAIQAKNPRAVCNNFKDAITTNLNKSSEENETIVYILKLLRDIVSRAIKPGMNHLFITKNEVIQFLSDCVIFGYEVYIFGCKVQMRLRSEILKIEETNQNFYEEIKRLYGFYHQQNENLLKESEYGKQYLNIDCNQLPENESNENICIKSTAVINIEALWFTIKNFPLIDCLLGRFANEIKTQISKIVFEKLTQYLTGIFGFILGLKFIWNICKIVYYLYKAFSNADNIKLKSQYWGEVAGLGIITVLDLINSKRKKLHRHKKLY